MNVIRTVGAVFFAALVALAAFGTQSAAPTTLCNTNPSSGACSAPLPAESFLEGNSSFLEPPTIETGVGNITCSASEIFGETTSKATSKGKILPATVETLSFEGCLLGGKACMVSAGHLQFEAQFQWVSGGSGEVKFADGGSGAPALSLVCGTTIDCTYTFESSLEMKGGLAYLIAKKDTAGSGTGKTCPKSSVSWSALYELNWSEILYVGDYAPTAELCKKNETPCPGGEAYAAPTTLAGGLESLTKAKFGLKITEESKETEYVVSCESSTLEGKTSEGTFPVPAQLTSLSFGECGGTCSVEASKLPYKGEIEATGIGNGQITLSSSGTGAPRFKVRCIGAYKCTYESAKVIATVAGGAPAVMSVGATLATKVTGESDEKCGSQLKWNGTYKFTKPESGGVAKMWIVREGI